MALRPANAAAAQPIVKQALGKPAAPNMGHRKVRGAALREQAWAGNFDRTEQL